MKEKYTAADLEVITSEMRRLESEHPKAKIYFDCQEHEIRITYPLPVDYNNFMKHHGKISGGDLI